MNSRKLVNTSNHTVGLVSLLFRGGKEQVPTHLVRAPETAEGWDREQEGS